MLNDDPARGRLDTRLEEKPWIAQDWATLPVAVKPSGENLDMAASLNHFGSYEQRRTQRKIEEAKPLAPKDLSVPKPAPRADMPIDIWTKFEVRGVGGETATEGRRGTVGADYRIDRRALIGVSVDVSEETPAVSPMLQQDTRLATYFAVKPWSPVTVDARAQWGESYITQGAGLVTTQSAVSARVRGDFKYDGFRLAPAVSVSHGVDDAAAEAAGTIEKSTLAVTPRLSRPFDLPGGGKVEPFLSLRSAIDFPSAPAPGGQHDTSHTVGGGLTLAKPDAYSLSVTTDVENPQSADRSNLKGRLELKLPLR